jgi:hypothetical protein
MHRYERAGRPGLILEAVLITQWSVSSCPTADMSIKYVSYVHRPSPNADANAAACFPLTAQVTSSTGLPYTLHLDLVPIRPEPEVELLRASGPIPPAPLEGDQLPDSPILSSTNAELPSLPGIPNRDESAMETDAIVIEQPEPEPNTKTREGKNQKAADQRRRRLQEVEAMRRMYCPCPGFMYNSLAGEKNFFVSSTCSAGRDVLRKVPN